MDQIDDVYQRMLGHQDVLGLIFHYLRPDPTDQLSTLTRQKHLLQLALSGRAFQYPALDALWSYLEHLSHLLKLLPSEYHSETSSYKLIKPIDQHKWDTFLIYARRIRVFGAFHQDENRQWVDVIDEIALRAKDIPPIIPARSLVFGYMVLEVPQIRSCFALFDMKELRSITLPNLTKPFYEEFFGEFLNDAVATAPNLTQIDISGYIEHRSTTLLPSFRHLRSLTLVVRAAVVSPLVLEDLSKHVGLETIVLDFMACTWVIDPLHQVTPPPIIFSTVRDIQISARTPVVMYFLSFLAASELPLLQSITIKMPISQTLATLTPASLAGDDVTLVFDNLAKGRKPLLSTIVLQSTKQWITSEVHEQMIRPLCWLPAIKSVTVNGSRFIQNPSLPKEAGGARSYKVVSAPTEKIARIEFSD